MEYAHKSILSEVNNALEPSVNLNIRVIFYNVFE